MAISVNWVTGVISVPKADMTLIQSSPVEVRELNILEFHNILRDEEDSDDGRVWSITHLYTPEAILQGITYALQFELLDPYTVTFEDGNYAVNIVGGNSNLGDRINLNQVSVRTNNSAGLISNQAIEYSSFNGAVTIDAINGTIGTTFPSGTPQRPVNNVADATLIAQVRGFSTLRVIGDYTFDTGDNIEEFSIFGQNPNKSLLTFNAGSDTAGIEVHDATVQGVFDDAATFIDCRLLNIQFVQGYARRCILEGEFTLSGSGQTSFYSCWDGVVSNAPPPSINFNGSGRSLAIRDYQGDISLTNKTGPESVEINMNSGGTVKIESTVTNGEIRLTGSMKVIDESTGTADIDVREVMFPDLQQLSAFQGYIHINTTSGITGTKFPNGTHQYPVNNLADALVISSDRGLNEFIVNGTLVVINTDISGLSFIGENRLGAVIVLSGTGNTTDRTLFRNMILVGRVNGPIDCKEVGVETVSNIGSTTFPTIFERCILRNDNGAVPCIQLNNSASGMQNVHLIECVSGVPEDDQPTLDANGSDAPIAIRKYGGTIELKNYTQSHTSTIEISEGKLVVDSSNTDGLIKLRGSGKLVGTSGGMVIDTTESVFEVADTIRKMTFNNVTKSGDIITVKEDNDVDDFAQYDLSDGQRIKV